MAAITATEDLILNFTRWEENSVYLSNNSIIESIEGGNHGQFGNYNDTLRLPILGQVDGEATITPQEQWNATIDAIVQIAMMVTAGGTDSPTMAPTTSASNDSYYSGRLTMTWVVNALLASLSVMYQF